MSVNSTPLKKSKYAVKRFCVILSGCDNLTFMTNLSNLFLPLIFSLYFVLAHVCTNFKVFLFNYVGNILKSRKSPEKEVIT